MVGPRVLGLGLAGLLAVGASVQGFSDCSCQRPAGSYPLSPMAYSAPMPAYYPMYAPIMPARYSQPVAAPTAQEFCLPECQQIYATPQPAPPSGSPTYSQEPPLSKTPGKQHGPVINHTRTFGGVMQNSEPRQNMCRVSFWNLSGFDLTLTVGDKAQTLPKDKAVLLDLDRNFSWKTNFHNSKSEWVPDDTNHFEVLVK